MPIAWRAEFSIDNAVIDDDHKHLIAIINNFEQASSQRNFLSALHKTLVEMRHYTKEHFHREEELQVAVNYPFARAHHHEHADLIKKLDQVLEDFADISSDRDLKQVHEEICALLKDWLVKHIIHSDLRLRPYVEAMRPYMNRMASLRPAVAPASAPAQKTAAPAAPVAAAAGQKAAAPRSKAATGAPAPGLPRK